MAAGQGHLLAIASKQGLSARGSKPQWPHPCRIVRPSPANWAMAVQFVIAPLTSGPTRKLLPQSTGYPVLIGVGT